MLKIGSVFLHSSCVEPSDRTRPMLCRVTAIREGRIYWRPVLGKLRGPYWFKASMVSTRVKEVVQ